MSVYVYTGLRIVAYSLNRLTTLRWSRDYMRNSMCLSITFEATTGRSGSPPASLQMEEIEITISEDGTLSVRCERRLETEAREIIGDLVDPSEHIEFIYTD